MVKTGDILYALYGATSGEVSISKLKGAINQAILAIRPYQNYDSQFLMQWLRKSKETIIGTYLQGGQGNLSGNIVKELLVDVPTSEEQKQIGNYFSNLDSLITLHQRKPIPHPNHPTIHTKHKGEEKYVRIRVNDREKINRTANLRRFPVDIPGGFKDGGRSVGEFQIYSGAE